MRADVQPRRERSPANVFAGARCIRDQIEHNGRLSLWVLRFGVSGPQDRAHGPFHLLIRTENPPLSVLLTGSPAPAKNENGVEITQVALVRPRDQKSLVTRWCVSNIGMPGARD